MTRRLQPALTAFALALAAMGTLALVYGDFALVWQPVPETLPHRAAFAYVSGILMLLSAACLLFSTTAKWASRILLPYLFAWWMLKVPAILYVPKLEAVWLNFGEIAVLFAGGWIVFATLGETRFLSGQTAIRAATILFGIALIPIGLSHLVYTAQTVDLIPAWMPLKTTLAIGTGAAQILCGLAALYQPSARYAAAAEAILAALFAVIVWLPKVITSHGARLPWTAFLFTCFFAASAWVVSCRKPMGANPPHTR